MAACETGLGIDFLLQHLHFCETPAQSETQPGNVTRYVFCLKDPFTWPHAASQFGFAFGRHPDFVCLIVQISRLTDAFLACVFARGLFSRKQKESASAPGWKLFGKVPPRESPPKDFKTIQQVNSRKPQIPVPHV